MQQNPNYNPNPQTPPASPSNQTYINTTPVGNIQENPPNLVKKGNNVEKIIQLIWFVFGFINVILALRIIFFLFNAQASGFRGFLYNITSPFIAPFIGIFPNPAQPGTYFDSAALVAIVIYSLAAWGITTLIRIIASRSNGNVAA